MEKIHIAGIIIIIITSVLILVFLFKKHDSFFNLRSIIKEHLGLFKNCKLQYIIFYILPLFMAIGLAMLYGAGKEYYSDLNVTISILLSMLLAVLSILTGKDFSGIKDQQKKEKITQVIKETINAILFNGLLCIVLLVYGLVIIIVSQISLDKIIIEKLHLNFNVIKSILSGISYYIFIVLLLNLLLVIKRVSVLIDCDLKSKQEDKE